MSDIGTGGPSPGWYPSEGRERYWDGNAWTDRDRALPPLYAPPRPAAGPPVFVVEQKPSHTLRNVLLALVVLTVLFVCGCFALLSIARNEVSKSIAREAANDTPTRVTEGRAFEHDGFAIATGWKVVPQELGGATIKRITVTLMDDQGVSGGGRSALLTFRLYDRRTVVAEITCSSNEMQKGESARMSCFNRDVEKLGPWSTIKVADAF